MFKSPGFTLLELAITLAILMIMATIALPLYHQFMASVELKNSGKYDGAEIVQLYIRDLVGSVTRPVKELKGFQKVAIKKGETKTITFEITEEDLIEQLTIEKYTVNLTQSEN